MSRKIFIKLSTLLIVALSVACGNDMKFNDNIGGDALASGGSGEIPGNPPGGGTPGGSGPGGGPGSGPGTGPGYVNETFNAPNVAPNSIDILFIDDDSRSMVNDHKNIASKFPGFINELQGLDWQIAITTTDVSGNGPDGQIISLRDGNNKQDPKRLFLTPAMPDAQKSFEHSIQREANGYGAERPIMAALHALQKRDKGNNAKFFRYGTPLAVVIVSDEDENSNAFGRTPNNPPPSNHPKWSIDDEPLTLINYAQSIPGLSLTVHAIAIPPGDSVCLQKQKDELDNKTDAYEGKVYSEAVSRTGGVFGSICSQDFSQTLKVLGQGVRQQLTSFTLKHRPNPTTVKVQVTPAVPGLVWNLAGNKIYFNMTLPKGVVVQVSYLPL